VCLSGGKTLTTAEGQTVLIVVLDNPLAEGILAVRPGRAVTLNGERSQERDEAQGGGHPGRRDPGGQWELGNGG
jgi:hypothetical protein